MENWDDSAAMELAPRRQKADRNTAERKPVSSFSTVEYAHFPAHPLLHQPRALLTSAMDRGAAQLEGAGNPMHADPNKRS